MIDKAMPTLYTLPMRNFEEWCSYKPYICIEPTPTHGVDSYFYRKWKEKEMETVQVKRFLLGDKITYPEKPYIGTANDAGAFRDPDNFRLTTNICFLRKAELIQEPKFYLRGIIVFEDRDYIFTAMVNLKTFTEADYQKLVWVAYDKVRFSASIERNYPKEDEKCGQ